MENVKMFLFTRWIAINYADDHLDKKMRHSSDKNFDKSSSMSILIRESGYWYKEKIKYFNTVVYPNLIKNGTVKQTEEFLKQ